MKKSIEFKLLSELQFVVHFKVYNGYLLKHIKDSWV